MIKEYIMGHFKSVVYWKPGVHLDDLSLKRLHKNLINLNMQSKSTLKHNMLDPHMTLEEMRRHYRNTIISEFFIDKEISAFLISPILDEGERSLLHIGLIMVVKNPGGNLMQLIPLGVICMAYEMLGNFYITNISSTPSSIENFSEVVKGSWPGPDVPLKRPPRYHKEILLQLKREYVDHYFPNPEKVQLDLKRSVLISNCEEMGFTVDFHAASRAERFKYNLFCHTWLNYQKEEDVIQVGKINWYLYWRTKVLFWFLRYSFKRIVPRHDQEQMDKKSLAGSQKEHKAA